MKTYSVCLLVKDVYDRVYWITNWGEYSVLEDVLLELVSEYVCKEDRYLGFGYMYGHNSHNLTSDRCRTELYLDFCMKYTEVTD